MSIWSKNHEELAKLAQSIEDRNAQTRRRIERKNLRTTWPNGRLRATRSKSDSSLLLASALDCNGHELSLDSSNEDTTFLFNRIRVDSFSSGDSAISSDFHHPSLSPPSILKLNRGTPNPDTSKLVAIPSSVSSSPKSPDKKVTFLLGNDDNFDARSDFDTCQNHHWDHSQSEHSYHDVSNPSIEEEGLLNHTRRLFHSRNEISYEIVVGEYDGLQRDTNTIPAKGVVTSIVFNGHNDTNATYSSEIMNGNPGNSVSRIEASDVQNDSFSALGNSNCSSEELCEIDNKHISKLQSRDSEIEESSSHSQLLISNNNKTNSSQSHNISSNLCDRQENHNIIVPSHSSSPREINNNETNNNETNNNKTKTSETNNNETKTSETNNDEINNNETEKKLNNMFSSSFQGEDLNLLLLSILAKHKREQIGKATEEFSPLSGDDKINLISGSEKGDGTEDNVNQKDSSHNSLHNTQDSTYLSVINTPNPHPTPSSNVFTESHSPIITPERVHLSSSVLEASLIPPPVSSQIGLSPSSAAIVSHSSVMTSPTATSSLGVIPALTKTFSISTNTSSPSHCTVPETLPASSDPTEVTNVIMNDSLPHMTNTSPTSVYIVAAPSITISTSFSPQPSDVANVSPALTNSFPHPAATHYRTSPGSIPMMKMNSALIAGEAPSLLNNSSTQYILPPNNNLVNNEASVITPNLTINPHKFHTLPQVSQYLLKPNPMTSGRMISETMRVSPQMRASSNNSPIIIVSPANHFPSVSPIPLGSDVVMATSPTNNESYQSYHLAVNSNGQSENWPSPSNISSVNLPFMSTQATVPSNGQTSPIENGLSFNLPHHNQHILSNGNVHNMADRNVQFPSANAVFLPLQNDSFSQQMVQGNTQPNHIYSNVRSMGSSFSPNYHTVTPCVLPLPNGYSSSPLPAHQGSFLYNPQTENMTRLMTCDTRITNTHPCTKSTMPVNRNQNHNLVPGDNLCASPNGEIMDRNDISPIPYPGNDVNVRQSPSDRPMTPSNRPMTPSNRPMTCVTQTFCDSKNSHDTIQTQSPLMSNVSEVNSVQSSNRSSTYSPCLQHGCNTNKLAHSPHSEVAGNSHDKFHTSENQIADLNFNINDKCKGLECSVDHVDAYNENDMRLKTVSQIMKDSDSQTEHYTHDKEDSDICHHIGFPKSIDIHVHPTISIPQGTGSSNDTVSNSSFRENIKDAGLDESKTKRIAILRKSGRESDALFSGSRDSSKGTSKDTTATNSIVSKCSCSNSSCDSWKKHHKDSSFRHLIRKIEKELLQFVLEPKDSVQDDLATEVSGSIVVRSSRGKRDDVRVKDSISGKDGIREKRNEVSKYGAKSSQSSSSSLKSFTRSVKSVTSYTTQTSVVDCVYTHSNMETLLDTMKSLQNLINNYHGSKKKGRRKGLKEEEYEKLLQLLDRFESKISSQRLKVVKEDLHDLSVNLRRQMKSNKMAVREEIENRCKLFTSERFTKGSMSDLTAEMGSGKTVSSCRSNILRNKYPLERSDEIESFGGSSSVVLSSVSSHSRIKNTKGHRRHHSKSTPSSPLSSDKNNSMDRVNSKDYVTEEQARFLLEKIFSKENQRQNTDANSFQASDMSEFQNWDISSIRPEDSVNPKRSFLEMVQFLKGEASHNNLAIPLPHSPNNTPKITDSRDKIGADRVLDITDKLDTQTLDDIDNIEVNDVSQTNNSVSHMSVIEDFTQTIDVDTTCPDSFDNPSEDTNNSTVDDKDIQLIVVDSQSQPHNNTDHPQNTIHEDTKITTAHTRLHKTNNIQQSNNDHNFANDNKNKKEIQPHSDISSPPLLFLPTSGSDSSTKCPFIFPQSTSAFSPIRQPPQSGEDKQDIIPLENQKSSCGALSIDGDVTETVAVKMEMDSQNGFQMDREFDKHLADMKPHVLKLPHKSDRQKCAVWIKKLCDPLGSSISARRTRNLHALLMLQMLKKGSLSSPFDQKPADGPLQPLPSYVAERIPDWVEGELHDTMGLSGLPRSIGDPAATSTWVSGITDLIDRPHSSMGHTLDKDPSLSPIRNPDKVRHKGYAADDMSIEVKRSPSPPRHRPIKSLRSPDREKRHLPDVKSKASRDDGSRQPQQDYGQNDDWMKPYNTSMASSVSLPKGTTFYEDIPSYQKPADREVAVRTKMIEAKFHEEKLKLQQKHDASVQKILDRKNAEIEDVKNHYRSKSKDIEEANGKMDKKVQTLLKEIEYVTQSKDKQISEMKKMAEDSNETRRNEFEKRLHDIMAEFEQEKFDMQKQHTQNIQEILDDTNSRLQRMEAEYSHQTTTTTNVIKELESRVHQLMTEVDSTLNQRSAVEKEKNEALTRLEKLTEEHERLKERSAHMDRQHQVATETQEHNLRTLKNKTEASLEFLKQENAIAASKAADTIKELEDKVDQLKKAVKETEEQRHRQIREIEQVHQQDKLHLENLHDKQIRNLKKEMEQQDSDWNKKMAKMEKAIREREEDINKLREQKQHQAAQSEQTMEEFKLQVEKNQARIYDEMKQQMDQVETDLTKSKQAREKQSKEFSRQMEEITFKQQHEIAELRMSIETEKSQIMRDFHVQKEFIISEHDKEVDNLKDVQRAEVQALEARLKERQEKSDKTSMDSERVIRELREELVQANQLRKQQLVELGLLREEEKQKVHRDHEAEMARQRTELEQQRLELQKSHSVEIEAVLEKTNERLKSIEKEYANRGAKSAESVAELQNVVLQLRGDIKKSRENSDDKLAELKHQYEEEKQNLRKQYSHNLATIQKEVESNRTRCRNLERQLQTEESDHEEKTTHLQLQYEERFRGLMSSDLKKELESTITSLKAQVSSLQQRSLMLQEELDAKNRQTLGPFGSRTSSPIKSSV